MALTTKQTYRQLDAARSRAAGTATGLDLNEIASACRQAEHYLAEAFEHDNAPICIAKAISIYQNLILLEPPLADPYLGIAYLALSAGRRADALAVLEIPVSRGVVDIRLDQMKYRLNLLAKTASSRDLPQTIARLGASLRNRFEENFIQNRQACGDGSGADCEVGIDKTSFKILDI